MQGSQSGEGGSRLEEEEPFALTARRSLLLLFTPPTGQGTLPTKPGWKVAPGDHSHRQDTMGGGASRSISGGDDGQPTK